MAGAETEPDPIGTIAFGAIEAVGIGKGVMAEEVSGEEAWDIVGVTEGSEGFATGRNSVCRIRPPASAVQTLKAMERVQPRSTAQPIQAA